jgi:hypothetical protein
MEKTSDEPQEHKDENILKPKRTRTMTEEAKKQYAERMKKVNEDRCEKARIANEAVLEAKEKEIQMKNQARLDLISKKKEQIKVAREKNQTDKPLPHLQEELKKRKTKKVILEDSSSEESTDYMDDDDDSDSSEEIVYVAKKSKKPKKEEKKPKERATTSLVKQKKQVIPMVEEANKTIIKFI